MIRPRPRRRISSSRAGFDIRLAAEERELLRELAGRLGSSLGELDPGAPLPDTLRRLLPVAHPRDDAAEDAYRTLAGPALLEGHVRALRALEEGSESSRLSAEELESWLRAMNSLRLVLGSSLGVTEEERELDPHDARYADWVCYHFLSLLCAEAVDALLPTLPEPNGDADELVPEDPWGDPPGGLRWDGTPIPGDPTRTGEG